MKTYVAYVLPPKEPFPPEFRIPLKILVMEYDDSSEETVLTKLRNSWDKEMKSREKFLDKNAIWMKMMHNYVHKNSNTDNDWEIVVRTTVSNSLSQKLLSLTKNLIDKPKN